MPEIQPAGRLRHNRNIHLRERLRIHALLDECQRFLQPVSRQFENQLVDAGRISMDESKPRTLSAASGDTIEIVRQRVCLELADGGKIYMDCNLQKPKAAPVTLSFDGVLDAKDMKGRIGRIIRCNSSYE